MTTKPVKRVRIRKSPEDRRQDILDIVVTCLAQLGPRASTGREVARRLGGSHGLLNHYFSTQEQLFLETYRMLYEQYLEALKGNIVHDGPPENALDKAFDALFSDAWGDQNIFGAWIAFWTFIRSDTSFAAVRDEYKAKQTALLMTVFERAEREDRLKMDKDRAATIMTAVMDGLWLEYCLSPDHLPHDYAVELCHTALQQLFKDQAT